MTRAASPLRILMIAPEPFFEPRGTPFSEYHRIKALGDLGHRVDLVTYPFGANVALPNLRIFRSLRPPLLTGVPIGPSVTKLLLDLLLTVTVIRRMRADTYDVIHSHEEAGLLGVWLSRWYGIPHLYDMHSSLPQQLANFRYTGSRLVRRVFEAIERAMIDGSTAVITICQELQDTVAAMGAGARSVLVENVMGGDVDDPPESASRNVRAEFGIDRERPVVLYTGTFESYQGLDLLLDAAARVHQRHPEVEFLIVGGEPGQVAQARTRAEALRAPARFVGRQPARDIPLFVQACDILVSPRVSGTNTPLKIYSYLRSGKPIVATNLKTHTQVLTPECALLSEPQPDALAGAIVRLVERPDERAHLADAARRLADAKYSRAAYLARTREAYELLRRRAGGDSSAEASAAPAGHQVERS